MYIHKNAVNNNCCMILYACKHGMILHRALLISLFNLILGNRTTNERQQNVNYICKNASR